MADATDKKDRELKTAIRDEDAKLQRLLLERLDIIAKKKKWKLEGLDVLYRLFAEKYHWTPSIVRGLTRDEIFALLEGEPV